MNNITNIIILIILGIVTSGCASNGKVISINGHEVEVECQPVYGKWCGKGYPAYEVTGIKPTPVDQWDSACMEHDLCYDQYGKIGEDACDRQFSKKLEQLDRSGIPAPHQIINAYNVFKDNKPYRQINITFKDICNANTVSCDGQEGVPTLFCDVGMGRDNCEISSGTEMVGNSCYCDYRAFYGQKGFFPGGRLFGTQKTANDF